MTAADSSRWSPRYTFSFINICLELVLLFLSYFLLWSSKVIFCYDRSQKKATNITTSHFHFSYDRKTAAWYELLLGNDSTCSLQHISDYWNDNDWSWKNATTVFILHTFTFMMTQSGKMRQIFVFSLSLFWWPERGKSDNYLCTHFHFLDDRRLSYDDRSKKTN